MADIIEIERALAMVQNFHPLQRVLLTCTGTLQGTLSAWFGGPMEIVVIDQGQQAALMVEPGREDDLIFHRAIEMKHLGKCMMRAASTIATTREDVRDLVLEQTLGLGQIMEKLGIRPAFKLLEADQDDDDFWRVYELDGGAVLYRIKEIFPQRHYRPRRPRDG